MCPSPSGTGLPEDKSAPVDGLLTFHASPLLRRTEPLRRPTAPTDRTAPTAPTAPTGRTAPAADGSDGQNRSGGRRLRRWIHMGPQHSAEGSTALDSAFLAWLRRIGWR